MVVLHSSKATSSICTNVPVPLESDQMIHDVMVL